MSYIVEYCSHGVLTTVTIDADEFRVDDNGHLILLGCLNDQGRNRIAAFQDWYSIQTAPTPSNLTMAEVTPSISVTVDGLKVGHAWARSVVSGDDSVLDVNKFDSLKPPEANLG